MADRESQRSPEKGASLVELLVGTVAIVVVLGATISTTVQSSKLRKDDTELRLAFAAAKNNIEELRTIPFAELPGMHERGFDVPAVNGAAGGLRAQPDDDDGLPGFISVAVDAEGAGETIYAVRVTVSWVGASGKRTFALETLMAQRKGS